MDIKILPEIKTKIQGAVSRGIKAVVINDEGHLLFILTDNSSINLGSVNGAIGPVGPAGPQGEQGVGIDSVSFNNDYTFTIVLTDGTQYTSSSIRGEKGEKGEKGDTYTLTQEDINEIAEEAANQLPEGAVSQTFTATISASGWTKYTNTCGQSVSIAELKTTDTIIVDLDMTDVSNGKDMAAVNEAWGAILKAKCSTDGYLFLEFSLDGQPTIDIPVKVVAIRK